MPDIFKTPVRFFKQPVSNVSTYPDTYGKTASKNTSGFPIGIKKVSVKNPTAPSIYVNEKMALKGRRI